MSVNAGTYEGTARLVDAVADFGRIQQGDVLVTRITSPYFNVVLPLLGAIVTDRGGQLCHAGSSRASTGSPGSSAPATRRRDPGRRACPGRRHDRRGPASGMSAP